VCGWCADANHAAGQSCVCTVHVCQLLAPASAVSARHMRQQSLTLPLPLLLLLLLLLLVVQLGYYGFQEQQALRVALLERQQELEQSEPQ